MTKRTRNIIFVAMVIIFATATPLLLMRIQGVRFDFEQGKFAKTGGIFVNTLNRKVSFYLDGKLKKTTNILSSSLFVKNLLPRKYKVKIEKPDYFSWQKNLEVKEEIVTEAKNIILFKKNYRFEILSENTEDFLISEDKRELLVKRNNETEWEYLLFNLQTNQWQKIVSRNDFREDAELELLEWDSKQKQILFQEINTETLRFQVLNYSLLPQVQIISFSLTQNIKKIALNKENQDEVIFLQKTNLFSKNFRQENGENLLSSDIVWFEFQNNALFLLTGSGFLTKTEASGTRKEVLNKTPLSQKEGGKFEIQSFAQNIFLKIGGDLYWLNSGAEFEKIYSPVVGLEVSPDGQKLAFWGGREIWLLKRDNLISPENLIFLNRFRETPAFLFWLNPDYLLFNIGEEIKITDTDPRDFLNIITIKTLQNPKIFFNEIVGKLYVLSEKILFSSEKLLP